MCKGPSVAEMAIVGVDDVSAMIACTVSGLKQDKLSVCPLTNDKEALTAISTDPQES